MWAFNTHIIELRDMNICLIKPPILHKGASFALMPTPPLGLAFIAGALKAQGHHIHVVDASAEGAGEINHFRAEIYVFGLPKEQIVDLIPEDADCICFSFMFSCN